MRDDYENNAQKSTGVIARTYGILAICAIAVVVLLFSTLPRMTAFIATVVVIAVASGLLAYWGNRNVNSPRV